MLGRIQKLPGPQVGHTCCSEFEPQTEERPVEVKILVLLLLFLSEIVLHFSMRISLGEKREGSSFPLLGTVPFLPVGSSGAVGQRHSSWMSHKLTSG